MQSKHVLPLLLLCASCGRPETVTETPEIIQLPPIVIPRPDAGSPDVPVDVSPTPTPTPTPTPSVEPTVTPTPAPAPTPSYTPVGIPAQPPDQYVGDYNAVTMQVTKDTCGGSCGTTFEFPATVVTLDKPTGIYTANGLEASTQVTQDRLVWSSTTDPHISTCMGSVETQTWSMSPGGTVREFKYVIQGPCHGGVYYTCECDYSN